ncbi:SWIM zinc finger family protein [Haloarchaeobius sp. HRN-SO-5]|uniref:SWIM zinc finger family protein n=1 Tax=Haloarchaeobius sp. HRN-SO-5 TaxID=3446118 RepID=UPI003EBD069B
MTVRPVPGDARLDPRSRRARTEAMAVEPLGSGRYSVTTEHGTYLVDTPAGRCTCPDHTFRGARCKHLRRVAIEITEGTVPPPDHVAVDCAVCATRTFVPPDEPEPHFCDLHRLTRGDLARDRETGSTVLVVDVSSRRADEVPIRGKGCTVAEYATNGAYAPDEPVVAAVFPSVSTTGEGVSPETLRVYAFPASRLERVRSD